MNNCVLYFHKRNDTNEIFYVGISNNMKRPFDIHYRTKFHKNIIAKYGVIIQIIKENLSWEQACVLEKFWIKVIGRRDLNEGTLVNLTDGGDGHCGFKQSKETIQKRVLKNTGKKRTKEQLKRMSLSQKGKPKNKETVKRMSLAKKGKPGRKLSEETKMKISLAQKGKPKNPESIRKMRQTQIERYAKKNNKL